MMNEAMLIGGLLAVGAILKHGFPARVRRWIPLITWSLGILVWCGAHGWNRWPEAILVAATATGIHSAAKNTFQKRDPQSGTAEVPGGEPLGS